MLALTQNVFAGCLCLFGPMFGFWGAYVSRQSPLGSLWGFAVSCFVAYAGWFVSGMVALNRYPDYSYGYPSESVAILFVIPGFVTGLGAVAALRWYARRPSSGAIFSSRSQS
jgi:hypothetical protein